MVQINRALVIREPWITHILAGRKTWEMRSQATSVRGPIGLIRQGTGMVVGVACLVASPPALTRANYMNYRGQHAIPEPMLDEVMANGWVYPWVMDEIRALHRPVRYRHKSGAVKFVILEPEVREAVAAQISDWFSTVETQSSSVPDMTREDTVRKTGKPPEAQLDAASASGVPLKERSARSEASPADADAAVPLFVFRPQKAQAYGRPTSDGRFLVRAGSTAMRNGSPNKKRDRAERDRLVQDGILVPDANPELYLFARDHAFGSASQAAGVVKDGNASGPQLWKEVSSDRTLKDFRSA